MKTSKTLSNYLFILLLCLGFSAQSLHAQDKPESGKPIATTEGKVNINTADAALLAATLKGVGMKKARAIVEYRESYGPFMHVDELAEVSGIGKATIEKNMLVISTQ